MDSHERSGKSVVSVEIKGSRELLWLSVDSPVFEWQVGDAVVFRSSSWRVTSRAEHDHSVVFVLAEPN
jgi:hypothetical protein